MDGDHRRQSIQRRAVQHEGVGELSVDHQGIRRQQLLPGRVLGAVVERAQGVLLDRVVRLSQRVPRPRIRGFGCRRTLQLRQTLEIVGLWRNRRE